MKADEAIYIIDGLLKCEMDPKYIELLQLCRKVLVQQEALEGSKAKSNMWPHCSKCGEPYAIYRTRNDVRMLKRLCACVDSVPKMRPRPAWARWIE